MDLDVISFTIFTKRAQQCIQLIIHQPYDDIPTDEHLKRHKNQYLGI